MPKNQLNLNRNNNNNVYLSGKKENPRPKSHNNNKKAENPVKTKFRINIEEEQKLLKELLPDIDHVTYEQLIDLEERMGEVSKGLPKEEIDLIPSLLFSQLGNSEQAEYSFN